MMSFRPRTSRYLARPRLLSLLPEKPGSVIWLEAPYGYGKSVLASQWAATLEAEHWRVIWLAADAQGVRRTVADGLSLPPESPWGAVLSTLWSEPTVLVLEDLENLSDHEELVPLLRDPRGLLLLASRGPLRTSEIPRLFTAGRLTHLRSAQLGFTEQEAALLMADTAGWQTLWQQAGGWPLPLHFAALTGELPDGQQLLSGLRGSLTPAEWQEALLLSTLPDLPADAGTKETARLASNGFVQSGTSGYRLHALLAEHIVANHAAEALSALKEGAPRLPPLLYGEALEKLGAVTDLAPLLDDPQTQLSRQAPQVVLRWDNAAPGPITAKRHVTAGMANTVVGRHAEAVNRFQAGLEQGGLDDTEELFALKGLVWSLALTDQAAAVEVMDRAEALLERADPEMAGRFLTDASYVHVVSGDHVAASALLERALRILPADSRFRIACHINLALNRWDSLGDYDGRLAAQTSTLADVWRLYPSDAPGQCRDVAMLLSWAGDRAGAREHLVQALSWERASPVVGLEVRAALAALDGDAAAFPDLFARAQLWQNDHTLDLIAMYAISTAPDKAAYYFDQVPAPTLAAAAYARHLPDRAEALRLIDAALEGQEERAFKLYLLAARYAVSREPADLEAFLALSTAGARLLPGHVPVGALPKERPELTQHYPIEELLEADWKEALSARLNELPDLQVDVLGKLNVRFAGRKLEFTERPMQLLIMLLLGLNREEAADAIWPDAHVLKQRNNLSVQLSALRRVLEPWGSSHFLRDDGLRRVRSDYYQLMTALEEQDHDAVLRLYREPFAPSVDLGALEHHRPWLREQVLTALHAAADAGGRDAGRFLTRILELDPLNEEALHQLLEHLLGRRRHVEARRRYEEFAERLREETGLEPQASTQALVS